MLKFTAGVVVGAAVGSAATIMYALRSETAKIIAKEVVYEKINKLFYGERQFHPHMRSGWRDYSKPESYSSS